MGFGVTAIAENLCNNKSKEMRISEHSKHKQVKEDGRQGGKAATRVHPDLKNWEDPPTIRPKNVQTMPVFVWFSNGKVCFLVDKDPQRRISGRLLSCWVWCMHC